MNGIIADLVFSFVSSDEEEHRGYYSALTTGYFDEIATAFEGKEHSFSLMTKLGDDAEAVAARSYYSSQYDYDTVYFTSTLYPTAISVEGETRLRYSALSDITEGDVVSYIDEKNIDTLFVSASLLSFKPVSREIVKGIAKRKDTLKRVVVDTTLDYDILLLEELKDSLEALRDSGVAVSVVGEALSIDGVRGMSTSRRDEMLSGLTEQEGQE